MEQSFQLPNEVCCSNGKESEISYTVLDQTNECKKVSTVSTSVSGSSKIKPVKIGNDTGAAVDSTTLAEQATALRRLKWISAFLAISTLINSATFGGLMHTLVSSSLKMYKIY